MKEKRCTDCKKKKPLSEYHKDKNTKDSLQYRCKTCMCKLAKQQYKRDRDKILIRVKERAKIPYNKACLRNNAMRTRNINNPDITNEWLCRITPIEDTWCPVCGQWIEYKYFDLDHLTPIARGGIHEQKNIFFICERCNQLKGLLTIEEFIKSGAAFNIGNWLPNRMKNS